LPANRRSLYHWRGTGVSFKGLSTLVLLLSTLLVSTSCTIGPQEIVTATGLTVEENLEKYGIPAQVIPFDYPVPEGLIKDPDEREAMIEAKLAHLQEVSELFWGDAPGEPEQRQEIFEEVWRTISWTFPGFPGLDLDWDAFYDEYYDKIGAAQSYGEFAYIITLMGYNLEEHHAFLIPGRWLDAELAGIWSDIPGKTTIPAFLVRGGNGTTAISTIGACYTATLEDELIVSDIWEDSPNPYHLQVGDEVVGFNGVPWEDWLPRLETAGIPIGGSPGGAESARRYRLLRAGMMNAHLFEKINVRRAATGEIETMDTVWIGPGHQRPCIEATDTPGLVSADDPVRPVHFDDDPMFVYGILPEENIGYMYIKQVLPGEMDTISHPDALAFADQFEAAVLSLMDTDGLIIDVRYNEGGRDLDIFFPGLAHLIQGREDRLVFEKAVRDPEIDDRSALGEIHTEHGPIHADEPDLYYENPIVVLSGPDSKGSGDWLIQFLDRFPEFTIVGRDPNGSFIVYGIKGQAVRRGEDYVSMNIPAVAFFDVEEQPIVHRSRLAGFIDKEIWFTREDVVEGTDTIREYAIQLIREARGKAD
jgi:hypothetical protein